MSNGNIENIITSNIFSMLLNKTTVPSQFKEKSKAVKSIFENDVSGLVASLTDFAVNTAAVNYNINTDNSELNIKLNNWLSDINREYVQIPSGIKELAKEYFKERWQGASFPVLKIAEWTDFNGLKLPTKMFFLDGGSITAQKKNTDGIIKIENYDYYLGTPNKNKTNKLNKNCIFGTKSNRWFDKYPTPYLIRKGIYRNWKLIRSLKNNQTKTLRAVIPYLLHITKGGNFGQNGIKTYENDELRQITKDMKNLIKDLKSPDNQGKNKMGVRAVNFDEEIKHLIPDLKSIFDVALFAEAERNILSGLGYIEILDAQLTSRREAVLNPKVFIEEVKAAVYDFKQIIGELLYKIKLKNPKNKKYMSKEFRINSGPIKGFMTDDFRSLLRQVWERGGLSERTMVEIGLEMDLDTELQRRKEEKKNNVIGIMSPRPIMYQSEDQETKINEIKEEDTINRKIPDDKKDPIEKMEYKAEKVKLITAPYDKLSELPKSVKDNMSKSLQKLWLRTFNEVLEETGSEDKARKAAWSNVKKNSRPGKIKKYVRK